MRLLIDSHALIWYVDQHQQLSPASHAAISDPSNDLLLSAVRSYQQKWAMTVLKAAMLFACETLLFVAVNIGEFVIAYNFV